jgi:steroid 5-alpha reductase family enzyme
MMNALELNLWILAGISAATWLASVLTKEYSWVDRIWSIAPIAYLWVFAAGENFESTRLNVMAVCVTLWGIRLTLNFARKGGYAKGGEDYRWPILRKKMSPMVYQLFNIVFIVIIQNALIFGMTVPAYFANPDLPFGAVDFGFAALFLGLLAFETLADQQQWDFHQAKKAGKAKGFLQTGLFSLSRHPNFFAEQGQWWVLYFWAAAATGVLWHWSIAGAFVLTALFAGSLRFTETITSGKYPEYRDYQKRVSALIPWFPRKG